jgi:hypothetical protein
LRSLKIHLPNGVEHFPNGTQWVGVRRRKLCDGFLSLAYVAILDRGLNTLDHSLMILQLLPLSETTLGWRHFSGCHLSDFFTHKNLWKTI